MNPRTLSVLAVGLVVGGLLYFTRPHRGAVHHAPAAGDSSDSNSTRLAALPRHPASPLMATIPSAETNPAWAASTNLLARLRKGDSLHPLTLEQVQGYLRDHHRNVESLLAAFHVTQDKSLLEEAKEKFPNDQRVDYAATTSTDVPSEEHRKWLDAFKQSAPDSALPDFLSASDYFKSGRTDLALQEVQAAANKPFQDYAIDFMQNAAEAYQTAGYSGTEAKVIASSELSIMEMTEYKTVGRGLVDLAQSYQQAGDTASAQASLQLAMDLGQKVNESDSLTLIQSLVGIAIEKMALRAMDPNVTTGQGDPTVQSQWNALTQQRDSLRTLTQQWDAIAPNMSDRDLANYFDRRWRFGQQAAMQWAVNKYGGTTGSSQR